MTQRKLQWAVPIVLLLFCSPLCCLSTDWSSDEIEDEPSCTYSESQLKTLTDVLHVSSRQMQRLASANNATTGILFSNAKSELARLTLAGSNDRCDEYLRKIEQRIVNITSELVSLRSQGSSTVGFTEKIKKLQEENSKINTILGNLKREYDQTVARKDKQFNDLLQEHEAATKESIKKVKSFQSQIYNEKVENIVLNIRYGHHDDAINKVKYFFDNDKEAAGKAVRKAVKEVYKIGGMSHWSSLMIFINKISSCPENIEGYEQLLAVMQPLTEKDTRILLKFAYKIKTNDCRNQKDLSGVFHSSIKKLIWNQSCTIVNKLSGHTMKVVREDQGGIDVYHMVGEKATSAYVTWKLSPYQSSFPDGEITFRVENYHLGKYLRDESVVEFRRTSGSADSIDAKWELRFNNNRINDGIDVYFYSPAKNKYLYEAKRSYEPWRCGFRQWLDCAVLAQEETKMYDEGVWRLSCN